ncbi:uncharacterized protein ANIA_10847 [Aspergillus nidulans FGSC A4]|uniref:Uncharacterized protein n=1 Tax=Emericella nidulans (strain FGSC A4 / ATCC 38163 / CBS 112.46 / NRRL 194 / M139) TaxID=227321 RepID=C8V1V2_EMENI|nr:hypothetical protein [Aspergillus nidulans FGSC A4]CBF71312.1 TPA: conserved hypothetical protein [Aspergillus nidulans FGSC A4]
MSYAEAAAKGPKQSPEEVLALPTSITFIETKREVKTTTQAERIEREEEESEEARERKEQAKNKAKAKAQRARENGGNPVFIGNAALLVLVGAGLGLGAYKKHTQGKLSWELVGLWTGAVGAFGAVDYFVSKWLLQNKYPPKH